MSRNGVYGVFLLAASLAGSGCQGKGGNADVEELKTEFNLQLALVNRHSEFLGKKVTAVEGKLDKVEQADRELRAALDVFMAKPEQIRREILGDVDASSQTAQNAQEAYFNSLRSRIDTKRSELEHRADERLGTMNRTLTDHDRFFRFVFTAQDSVNAVFASRFDQRPWYQSVLGRWEDRRPSE